MLFDATIENQCGVYTSGSTGPVYCTFDQTMYFDVVYGNQAMAEDGGDGSIIAITVAHEVGHHVSALMGWPWCTEDPCIDASQITVLELENQADCFAGAWTADAEGRGRLHGLAVEQQASEFALEMGGQDEYGEKGHGRGALRTFWYLAGYYYGTDYCLTASPASDPEGNGA